MLELLSGREHRVYSGLCLWPPAGGTAPGRGWPGPRSAWTRWTDEQIDEYLDSGQWQGKAGAFGYQDRVGWLQIVDGSESNVIGLPLELLAEMLGSRIRRLSAPSINSCGLRLADTGSGPSARDPPSVRTQQKLRDTH